MDRVGPVLRARKPKIRQLFASSRFEFSNGETWQAYGEANCV